jgi:hypothetical protein
MALRIPGLPLRAEARRYKPRNPGRDYCRRTPVTAGDPAHASDQFTPKSTGDPIWAAFALTRRARGVGSLWAGR